MTELSTHVFELNLTSVCVRSGEIQLPLKMLEFFAPGRLDAELDGERVELGFQAPRRLYGLQAHFGARGLKSNDRVRFVLDVEQGRAVGLTATCVKRERQRPTEGEAEQGRPDRSVEASRSTPVARWESVEEVRAIKRVRIPGLPAAQSPSELTSVHEAPTGNGRIENHRAERSWEHEPTPRGEAVSEDGLTTVRVKRRQRDSGEAVPAPEPVAAAGRGPSPEPQVVRPLAAEVPLQLSDLIAPPIRSQVPEEKSDTAWRPRNWAALTSRMRLGTRPSAPQLRDRPYTSGPRDASASAGSDERDDDFVEARELVAVTGRTSLSGDETVGPARPVSRATSTGMVGEDAPREPGIANNGPHVAAVAAGAVRDRTMAGPSVAGGGGSDNENRADALRRVPASIPVPMSFPSDPAPAKAENVGSPGEDRRVPDVGTAPSGAKTDAKVGRSEPRSVPLIDDADFGGEYLVEAKTERVGTDGGGGGLEEDIGLVEEFLRRPNTPAIIRAEAVGEILAIGEERAERALERLSERPDHVNRIRRGAYMVRGRRG